MMIKITSKLQKNAAQRLRRAAERYAERYSEDDCYHTNAFTHVDRNTCMPLHSLRDPHSVARHMMVCAGVTFDYEIV